jgi:UDP-N-acetylmuramoyl-L-alanyl-D-glutamate--2,6-diaminopimelate ligase
VRVSDRREAIRRALLEAREGDVILLAGKGHETYQIVGREKRSFDERIVVKEILAERATSATRGGA